jgi:O6-methylguanine-DNA--protein-cysteine methyltransferase
MQTAVYGASVETSLFGKVGFTFNNSGQLLELSWREGFSEEASKLARLKAPCPSLTQLRTYMKDYARGCGPQFPGEYVFPQAAAFSTKVYRVVEKLKSGQSFSYQQVAELAGSSKACRAVGNIMGKNPLPLVIP